MASQEVQEETQAIRSDQNVDGSTVASQEVHEETQAVRLDQNADGSTKAPEVQEETQAIRSDQNVDEPADEGPKGKIRRLEPARTRKPNKYEDARRVEIDGEVKYECADCNRTFTRIDNLRAHEWHTHKQPQEYRCEFCPPERQKRYKRPAYMRKHVKKEHRDLWRPQGTTNETERNAQK